VAASLLDRTKHFFYVHNDCSHSHHCVDVREWSKKLQVIVIIIIIVIKKIIILVYTMRWPGPGPGHESCLGRLRCNVCNNGNNNYRNTENWKEYLKTIRVCQISTFAVESDTAARSVRCGRMHSANLALVQLPIQSFPFNFSPLFFMDFFFRSFLSIICY